MKQTKYLLFLLILLFTNCNRDSDQERTFPRKLYNIKNVKDKILDIEEKIESGPITVVRILDKYLIITDLKGRKSKGIHIYNKNTFEYLTSTAILGKGPGEITRIGVPGIDQINNNLWISDHASKVMWEFPIDSILRNNFYKPTKKLLKYDDLFLAKTFNFLNDSIVLGGAVHVVNNNSFEMTFAKLNIINNKIETYGYQHPEAMGKIKSNFRSKLSVGNNLYVMSYINLDLMTICDLKGNLKYNIYGPNWLKNTNNKNAYFKEVDIYKNYIIAAHDGGIRFVYDEYKRPKSHNPTKFLVFDVNGDYNATIETGHHFSSFCVDEENERVIVYFDDRENPLGYFNIKLD